jgi:response regulator RpfG family c-di-GMP phosphodiesterase
MTTKPTILCVDDEPVNLKLLYDILEPSGFSVIMANDGREVLGIVRDKQVDVILMDVMMPKMDGFEVCRLLKLNPLTRNIPIIMLTSLGSKEDRIHGINVGADEFLTKPFDSAEVLARINMLMKVKRLNDKVDSTYRNITRLTSFGEEILKSFDPLNFDFETVIDTLVNQIIRRSSDMQHNPAYVLVRTFEKEKGYRWRLYEYIFDNMKKTWLDIDQRVKVPILKDVNLFFYNSIDRTVFVPLVAELRLFKLKVLNLVCYVGRSVSIFCFNYGRSVSSYDAGVLNTLVLQTLFLRSLSEQVIETSDAYKYCVSALARAAEAHDDDDTSRHINMVGLYCAMFAKKLNMNERFVDDIYTQSQLHDVGMIHIPSGILKKPDNLTREEFAIMKNHTSYGAKIIGVHRRFRVARTIASTHHEKWDGSGYPVGLSYDNIPIEGRIAALADQYAALRNKRVYREAFDHETACRIIIGGDGRTIPQHFDPKVLKVFKDIASVFDDAFNRLYNPKP